MKFWRLFLSVESDLLNIIFYLVFNVFGGKNEEIIFEKVFLSQYYTYLYCMEHKLWQSLYNKYVATWKTCPQQDVATVRTHAVIGLLITAVARGKHTYCKLHVLVACTNVALLYTIVKQIEREETKSSYKTFSLGKINLVTSTMHIVLCLDELVLLCIVFLLGP